MINDSDSPRQTAWKLSTIKYYPSLLVYKLSDMHGIAVNRCPNCNYVEHLWTALDAAQNC